MENNIARFDGKTPIIQETIAERIHDLQSKDIITAITILGAVAVVTFVTVCLTKTNVSVGHGQLEITHPV